MNLVIAFLVGGAICLVAQLALDLTNLDAAHTMVLFVSLGAVAGGLGLYEPLVQFSGAGALVPLPSFGNALVKGVLEAWNQDGPLAMLGGALEATAVGLGSAILFGWLVAVVFQPKG